MVPEAKRASGERKGCLDQPRNGRKPASGLESPPTNWPSLGLRSPRWIAVEAVRGWQMGAETMSAFREILLGSEALEFIRDHLTEGGMLLARDLLQYCDLENGQVMTYLPTNVSDDEARKFATGGKLETPMGPSENFVARDGTRWTMKPNADTDLHLVRTIQAHLRRRGRRWCIFEDALGSPSDPRILSGDDRIRVLGSEVYYLIGEADVDDEARILKTVRDANSAWRFACTMSSIPEPGHFSEGGRSLKSDEVRILAERAEKIAVSAYDGEGYLIWSKDRKTGMEASRTRV